METSNMFAERPILDQVWDKCAEFSGMADTSHYATRGQTNPSKRKHDTFVGKLAECHAWYTLKEICPISKPDFKIYPKGDKSWLPDLRIATDPFIQCHVKGQDTASAKRYGMSWVCQFKNPDGRGGKDKELFENPGNSLIICVSVDTLKRMCNIRAIVPAAKLLSDNLYGEMFLEQHRGFKKAIYAETNDLGPGLKEHGLYETLPAVMEEWDLAVAAR
jgi:hypothetical protein